MTGPLQALAARYDALAAQGLAPTFGFEMAPISCAIMLDPDGRPVGVEDLRQEVRKKWMPGARLVPSGAKRTSGIAASALWDKSSYVLGRSAKPTHRILDEHAAFKQRNRDLLRACDDDGARALLRFLDTWRPEMFDAPPFQAWMLDCNFVFRLSCDLKALLHERPAVRDAWLAQLASEGTKLGPCLVSGREGPLERLHPTIKGVAGAQSSGASLVSFNQDAFTSHGKEQGANAPVSEAACFAYGTALNALLARGSDNRVQIGDATTVFWADVPAADSLVRSVFDPPPPDSAGETARLRDQLEQIAAGQPVEADGVAVSPGTAFHLLGLSPNAARLSVRFWQEGTLGSLARNARQHWEDLRLNPDPWRGGTPPMWLLLRGLAAQGKSENVPAHLAGELTRAILTGRRYPRSLPALLIMRMRADRLIEGRRIALLKACLVRDRRLTDHVKTEDYLVSLDPTETNEAYRLGRLFAVLENIQRLALPGLNATIRDRFYGAASATPGSIFPMIMHNATHHVANLRKGGKGGLAVTLEREMGGILNGFGTSFPRSLSLEDQGRFAIGYYHQRFSRRAELETAGADDIQAAASKEN